MAKGNPRSSKRSSASSSACPSTLTTAIFVSLCVLGVWFLSSNSYSRPQAASKSSNAKAQTTKITSSIANSRDDSRRVIPSIGEKNLAHEDVSGMLPDDDAVKSSEAEKQDDSNEIRDESNGSENNVEESNESQSNENQETELEKNDEPIGDDGAKNEAEEVVSNGGRESAEEEEKQSSLETQTSEESSVTHIEQVKETKNEEDQDQGDHSSSDDNNDNNTEDLQRKDSGEETSVDDNHQEAITETKTEEDQGADTETVKNEDRESETLENQISKEDEDKRLQEHQQQEEDRVQEWKSKKDPNGAISNSQIEHDEAPLDEDGPRATEETNKSAEEDNPIKSTASSKKEGEVEEASFPDKESTEIPKESKESKKAWSTQRDESTNQKERGTNDSSDDKDSSDYGHTWHLCNETAGADYIPCLDNEKAIAKLHSRKHHEHRERHCPEDAPTCLVPLPKGYKTPVQWPQSRDKIWFHNVPHTSLANVKGHQNWVKVTGEFLTFPGGGTQFIHGAMHYIDFIQEAVPDIAWGKHTRVILDVGCGVASFGGYLFDRDVLTMSFAPKDEHEAQVQFALERGIPAISAVMGSQRLPFPSKVFDIVHCARCRVPWHADGGALLLELNRVLRPGGYFVWSATPVYQKLDEDVQIWQEMSNLTVAMCWELVTIKKDKINMIGAAVYQKPDSNDCYEQRKQKQPPMCKNGDDPNAAWYVPLQSCMHRVPTEESERGSQWPEEWPDRLQTPPYWLNKSQMGIYGKPAPEDFSSDHEHWKKVVNKLYMNGLGISWSTVRNVMDMRAVYGGFAAALKDLKIWVMNVVNVDSPDTLPIIYERGLFGIYHDWCESFSTYPRTYDLLHADHLFSRLKKRCKLVGVMAEIDRIVRPGGILIVRDDSSTVGEAENLLKSLQWEVHLTFSQNKEGILSAQKSNWRPTS